MRPHTGLVIYPAHPPASAFMPRPPMVGFRSYSGALWEYWFSGEQLGPLV